MAYTPAGIISSGFPLGDFTFTYALSNVAGLTGVAAADDVVLAALGGKAVSLDTTAASTVKPTADGDIIFGRIYVAENRAVLGLRVASVARKFKEKLPAAVGHGMVVGDRIVGAAGGLVRKDTAAAVTNPIVVETGVDFVVAEKL